MKQPFYPKFFSLLKLGITRKQAMSDLFAGIVVGIVALPMSIAFAIASGLSPEKGIITAIVAGFIVSLLGGSRVQIAGPTGAFVVIIFGILQKYGYEGLVISTILAGIFLIIFGLLKLGDLLKYLPHPLIVGFTSGIALVIASTQVKDALGLPITNIPAEFLGKWSVYLANIAKINPYAIIITIATILILTYTKNSKSKIPGSLIAIFLFTIIVKVFQIPVTTIETFYGEIHAEFSFTLPHIHWSSIVLYLKPALAIALLGGIESLLSAVVSDGMIGANHRSNTELIAQGIANIFSPLFGGIPATGALARAAANVKNGGRTPIAGMVHSAILLLSLVFFGGLAKLIPMSCLSGILIVVAYNMSEWRSFLSILRGSFFDVIILVSTFILTVFVDLIIAIEVGVVLSSLLFMKRMADFGTQNIDVVDQDLIDDYSNLPEQINVYEISGPLFFGSAKAYTQVIKQFGNKSKVLIIRMRHVPFVDSTGVNNLKDVLKILKNSGVEIILSGVNKSVLNEFEKNNIFMFLNQNNIFNTFSKAIDKAKKIIE